MQYKGKKFRFTKRFWILLCALILVIGAVIGITLARQSAHAPEQPAAAESAAPDVSTAGSAESQTPAPSPSPSEPAVSANPQVSAGPIITPTPSPAAKAPQEPEQPVSAEPTAEKVVYLTFDDGPSGKVTPAILDTLKDYQVPATFFVLGKNVEKYPELVQREYQEGHKIANHSYSHDYNYIYGSVKNLLEEIQATNKAIDNALGFSYGNTVFRFPGGSFGRTVFKNAVTQSGYRYVDWNCLGSDAVKSEPVTPDFILSEVKKTARGQQTVTVLLHDSSTKETTAQALPGIIEYFKSEGYTFKALENI